MRTQATRLGGAFAQHPFLHNFDRLDFIRQKMPTSFLTTMTTHPLVLICFSILFLWATDFWFATTDRSGRPSLAILPNNQQMMVTTIPGPEGSHVGDRRGQTAIQTMTHGAGWRFIRKNMPWLNNSGHKTCFCWLWALECFGMLCRSCCFLFTSLVQLFAERGFMRQCCRLWDVHEKLRMRFWQCHSSFARPIWLFWPRIEPLSVSQTTAANHCRPPSAEWGQQTF